MDAARVETHLDEEMFKGAQNKSVEELTSVTVTLFSENLKRRGVVSFCGGGRSILAVSSGTDVLGYSLPQNYVVACDPRCKW